MNAILFLFYLHFARDGAFKWKCFKRSSLIAILFQDLFQLKYRRNISLSSL